MTRNQKIAAVILGAATALAVYRFWNLEDEERKELFDHLKTRTGELLDDTEKTSGKINDYLNDYDSQNENAWIDKLYILKKMVKDLYGSEKHFLL